MAEISLRHTPILTHHVSQGIAWLYSSEGGNNTAAISYAAFELRFAIEHLTVHYWAILLGRQAKEHDLHTIDKFDRLEGKIYELGGHQREIDDHFEFMRIVLRIMKIDKPLHTPKIGQLKKFWGRCSEYCHIAWPLSCDDQEARKSAFSALTEISQSLGEYVDSLGWPVLNDQPPRAPQRSQSARHAPD